MLAARFSRFISGFGLCHPAMPTPECWPWDGRFTGGGGRRIRRAGEAHLGQLQRGAAQNAVGLRGPAGPGGGAPRHERIRPARGGPVLLDDAQVRLCGGSAPRGPSPPCLLTWRGEEDTGQQACR